ncbi:MAG: exosortase/archaeosortase family protein [Bradymonadia bacterium]
MFGGTGSAVLTPFISLALGWLAVRRSKTRVSDAEASRLPYDFILLLMPAVLILSLLLFNTTEWWFGICALLWPLWVLALIQEGWGKTLRVKLNFPVLFLWFAFPIEPLLYDVLDTPLQEVTTDISVNVLSVLGYQTKYWNPHTFYSNDFYIIVDETCSGMNLLVTLFMYALIFGWIARHDLRQRLLLCLSVVPLALFSNGLRVAAIYLLGLYGGTEAATGIWHEGSGVLAFLPTLIGIYALSSFLRRLDATSMRKTSAANVN